MSHHGPYPDPPASGNRSRSPRTLAILAIAWSIALAAAAASRFRGEWEAYKAIHRWCANQGVPDWVRNLDSILFGAAAFLGAALIARWSGGSPLARLLLHRGQGHWGRMVLIAPLPMVVGGAVLAGLRWTPDTSPATLLPTILSGAIRAPIAEELLFRGLLIGTCSAALGWRGPRFWINATAAALLFAVMHVPWTSNGLADGWATMLLTGAGGVWFAWHLMRWQSLWVPILLHAGMNLGWLLAGAAGGAGGGGWVENLLRAVTITIATWWTVRRTIASPTAA
ncbi:MAG: CPBP family intramembrane metalloprotease [Phycisphaeraceae bacterium]|nr:CPBP family intramembrane metalloprotease [Phycisphaeraceae bacterium]